MEGSLKKGKNKDSCYRNSNGTSFSRGLEILFTFSDV